jgi:hypothetical protein
MIDKRQKREPRNNVIGHSITTLINLRRIFIGDVGLLTSTKDANYMLL